MQAKLSMTVGPEGTTGIYLDGCPLDPLRSPYSKTEYLAERYLLVINWCQWDIFNGVGVVQGGHHLFEIVPMLHLYGDAY